MRFAVLVLPLAPALALAAPQAAAPSEITLDADQPIDAVIAGRAAKLQIYTGTIDRLTLGTDFVAANGIRPADFLGTADLKLWGKKEIRGYNRPVKLTVGGIEGKQRAVWFRSAEQPRYDGHAGPMALPQDIVNVRLRAAQDGETLYTMPFWGDIANGSYTAYLSDQVNTLVAFPVESALDCPLATAATGAAIAAAYGGTLSGDRQEVPMLFGLTRPVRLMTLERPFKVGPFAFSKIWVRIRGTRDRGSAGEGITDADADPQEILVETQGKDAKKPAFNFSIPRVALKQCSMLTFDKVAKQIRLSCRPA